MTYNLFLDDERFPPDDKKKWFICRTFGEAVVAMQLMGCPQYMSFDHDLGDAENGFNVAQWMVEQDLNCFATWIPKDFSYAIHSMNPIGAKNIDSLLRSYLNFK